MTQMYRIQALLLTTCLLLACGKDVGPALTALEQATTPEQEAAAFQALEDSANVLGIIAYDDKGTKLPGEEAPWTGRVVKLGLRVNGEVIEHQLISPDNLSILLDP